MASVELQSSSRSLSRERSQLVSPRLRRGASGHSLTLGFSLSKFIPDPQETEKRCSETDTRTPVESGRGRKGAKHETDTAKYAASACLLASLLAVSKTRSTFLRVAAKTLFDSRQETLNTATPFHATTHLDNHGQQASTKLEIRECIRVAYLRC